MESRPVRIEELLAHAGWVRKLAGRLVRDAGTADDVSQEVWTHALRSPPHDRTNLRAWLATAVRNSVRSLKRAEVRRVDREAAVEGRHEEPPTSEIVERAQLHRLLVEQVLALPEPQRSIVLAHWFEEQSIAEIARRQYITERVAKSRLDAGHALLRQRLDKSSGGRAAWCIAFTNWTGPSFVPVGAGTALTVGGLFVASKLALGGAAVVVAVAAGWMLWPTLEAQESVASAGDASEIHVPGRTSEAGELVQQPTGRARESLTTAAQSDAAATPAAAAQPRWVVRGHVRGAPAGRESETKLTARTIGQYHIPNTVDAVPRSDGTFELDVSDLVSKWRGASPKEIQVVALHPACLRVQVQLPFDSALVESTSSAPCHEYRCDFNLITAAVVTGRIVVPPDWSPVHVRGNEPKRPQVSLLELGSGASSENGGLDNADCDANGNWTLRSSHSGTFTVLGFADTLRPASLVVDLVVGRTIDAGVLELGRGASISGVVRRKGMAVGAGFEVMAQWNARTRTDRTFRFLSPSAGFSSLCASGSGFEYTQSRTSTRADGSYTFEGLAPAEYQLSVSHVPGARWALGGRMQDERIVHASQAGVDLEEVPPTIELAVTIAGRTATNADLEDVLLDLIPPRADRSVSIDLTHYLGNEKQIQIVAGDAYELRVPHGRYSSKNMPIGPFVYGEEYVVPVDLVPQDQGSTLIVHLVTENAKALRSVDVAMQELADTESEPRWRTIQCTDDGTIIIRNQPAGRYRVHVHAPGPWSSSTPMYFLRSAFDVVLPPKSKVEHELRPELGGRIRVSAKNSHGDFVRATVDLRDSRNEKVSTDFYCLIPTGLFGCTWYLCEEGINDHPPLPVGHYELGLSADGYVTQVVPFDIVRGETKTLEVVLQPR